MQISLANWNQDEEFGGFGPHHCMVKGGYSTLTDALARQVDVRLGQPVKRIAYNAQGVTVTTASGEGWTRLATVIGGLEWCSALTQRLAEQCCVHMGQLVKGVVAACTGDHCFRWVAMACGQQGLL